MKLNRGSRSTFLLFLALGLLIGSLAWEIFERILAEVGVEMALGVGPIAVDLHVLEIRLLGNPGTLLGALGGAVLFRLM